MKGIRSLVNGRGTNVLVWCKSLFAWDHSPRAQVHVHLWALPGPWSLGPTAGWGLRTSTYATPWNWTCPLPSALCPVSITTYCPQAGTAAQGGRHGPYQLLTSSPPNFQTRTRSLQPPFPSLKPSKHQLGHDGQLCYPSKDVVRWIAFRRRFIYILR